MKLLSLTIIFGIMAISMSHNLRQEHKFNPLESLDPIQTLQLMSGDWTAILPESVRGIARKLLGKQEQSGPLGMLSQAQSLLGGGNSGSGLGSLLGGLTGGNSNSGSGSGLSSVLGQFSGLLGNNEGSSGSSSSNPLSGLTNALSGLGGSGSSSSNPLSGLTNTLSGLGGSGSGSSNPLSGLTNTFSGFLSSHNKKQSQ